MNIYITFELKQRELLSKLFLALEAASRGNEVFLGRINTYLERGFFKPGLIHFKSITPGESRIRQLENYKKKGFKTTSLDEENGFIDYENSYKNFRFSNKTFSLIDKVFTWGPYDFANLLLEYPSFKSKIVKSGNPRIDFWRKDFKKFYHKIDYIKYENYIFFSTNFDYVCSYRTIKNEIKFHRDSGYFKRGLKPEEIIRWATNSKILFKDYKKSIIKISKKFKDRTIVIRPHPVDDPEKWKSHFKNINNIVISSEGFISDWIDKAKVVIHAGCTGGLESSVRNKTTISYYPKKIRHGHPFADYFSKKIFNEKKLLKEIENIYSDSNEKIKNENKISQFLNERSYNFFGEPSYKKIVSTWQKILKKTHYESNNLFFLKFSFRIRDIRLKLLGKKIGDHKFDYFNKKEVSEIISRLKKIDKKFSKIKIEYIKSDIIRVYK